METSRSRRHELFAVTLTELVLLVLFLILLLLVPALRSKGAELEKRVSIQVVLENQVNRLKDRVEELEVLRAKLEEKAPYIEELRVEIVRLENRVQGLETLLVAQQSGDPDDFVHLVRTAANNMQELEILRARDEESRGRLVELEERNASLLERVRESGGPQAVFAEEIWSEDFSQADSDLLAREVTSLRRQTRVLEDLLLACESGEDSECEAIVSQAVAARVESETERDELRDELTRKDSVVEVLTREINTLRADLGPGGRDLAGSNRELRAQLANLQRRSGHGGRDYPACWSVETEGPDYGRAEYLFNITIYEDGIEVRPGWPESRATDASHLPAIETLSGERLSRPEFRQLSSPLLAYSKDNNCRHYVRVIDQAESKKAYKTNLQEVEGVFYKYLVREG